MAIDRDAVGEMRSIGVALSGGGFRATAWGLGAIVGLVRARETESDAENKAKRQTISTVSIASVSGGSIANAALALHLRPNVELDDISVQDLLEDIACAARHVAFQGLIRYASATNVFIAVAFVILVGAAGGSAGLLGAAIAVGRSWDTRSLFVWPCVIGGALFVVLLALLQFVRSLPWPERVLSASVVGAVGAGFGAGSALVLHFPGHRSLVVAAIAAAVLLLWSVALRLVSWRGARVERALDRTILRSDGSPVSLRSCKRHTHQVFCATELQSGEQFFLSPHLIYGYRFGWRADPGTWTLARAVQGSAALPGGFPPQRTVLSDFAGALGREWPVDSPPIEDATRVVLVDGGVYDNMATEWEVGFDQRNSRLDGKLESMQARANFLIVANAGKGLEWKRIWPRGRLRREFAGLTRDQSIQYDQTTAARRRALVAMFRAAEKGAVGLPCGVVVQASTSPLAVARAIAEDPTEDAAKRARAETWIAPLSALELSPGVTVDWAKMAGHNSAVPTVLHALGATRTIDLLWHAAVLTQVQLHIHYNIGAMSPLERYRFAQIVEKSPPA
jgi:predicted acylesterase/phospholipase RssA